MSRRNSSSLGRQRGGVSLAAFVVLSLSLAVSAIAWAASATPPHLLKETDRELLAKLGPGVIGKPIAPPSEKEIAAAVVRPRSARFRMVAGPRAGQTVEVTTKAARELPNGNAVKKPTWIIDIPGVMTQYVVMDELGLTAPALLLQSVGLFSEYVPIEPLLIFGLGPGESKSYPTKAAARHVSKPKVVAYGGEVTVTYRNLGAYEIHTPAGTFPGLVIRCDYVGKIGPAQLNLADIRIYAPGEGLIALSGHDRFQVFLVFNKKIVNAFILEDTRIGSLTPSPVAR